MEVPVLVSPAAGAGRARAATGAVLTALRDAGLTPRLLPATTRAEAEKLAAEAVGEGAAALAALGGDGAAPAARQPVAGPGPPLAVLPAGTGNDLALALGVPADPVAAARAAAEDLRAGRARGVDAGRAGGRWWATVLCCGFDSALTGRATRLRWPRGRRRYDVAILAELARLRARELTLVLDGEVHTLPVTLVALGNTGWYGGGMRICPGADPGDGRFDVTVVGPMSRRELVRSRPLLTAGTHVDHPAVSVHRPTRGELSGPGDPPLRRGGAGGPAAGHRRLRARRAAGAGRRPRRPGS